MEFATISAADLDKSGVTFDRVPLAQPEANPAQPGAFLQYAVGESAVRLFQTLLHVRGKVIQAPLITTTTTIPATIQVIQTSLTLTPRINSDDSISLSIASQAANTDATAPATEPQATNLRTIRSGDMMVVAGWPLSSGTPLNGQKLLIFVTPTIIGTAPQRRDGEQPNLLFPPVRETSPTTGKTVFIDVFNADLHMVVAMLERQLDLKALVQDTDGAYKPVYVHLNGASLSEALGAIARSAGAQIIRNERGVYVFSPLPGSAQPPAPEAPAKPKGPPVIVNGSTVTVTP